MFVMQIPTNSTISSRRFQDFQKKTSIQLILSCEIEGQDAKYLVFLITFSLDSISSCRNLTTYHHTHEEGIISLPGKINLKCRYSNLNLFFFPLGYLAIQLLGLSVDTIILPPFPSFFRSSTNDAHQQAKK